MFIFSPEGMVRTAPGSTITFAGEVTVVDIEQLDGMVQSPEAGGPHESELVAESTSILGNESPLPESDIVLPVPSRSDKMLATEADGFFSFSMAKAPDTAGVAKEVPLPVEIPPPGIEDVTDSPGAMISRNEALSENIETWSVSFVEPTLIADEMQAGEARALTYPSFPAATTGAMPADWRVSNSDL